MKKKQEENVFFSPAIQKSLARLISEEYYAYKLYMTARLMVCAEEAYVIEDLFKEISEDEIDDHMKELVKWCRSYGYDIPCCETDFSHLASAAASKQVRQLKKNKDAGYYLEEGLKSEQLALDSYKKAIETDGICEFTDLQALLWHIYYDEAEHMEKLNSAKIAYDANARFVM